MGLIMSPLASLYILDIRHPLLSLVLFLSVVPLNELLEIKFLDSPAGWSPLQDITAILIAAVIARTRIFAFKSNIKNQQLGFFFKKCTFLYLLACVISLNGSDLLCGCFY